MSSSSSPAAAAAASSSSPTLAEYHAQLYDAKKRVADLAVTTRLLAEMLQRERTRSVSAMVGGVLTTVSNVQQDWVDDVVARQAKHEDLCREAEAEVAHPHAIVNTSLVQYPFPLERAPLPHIESGHINSVLADAGSPAPLPIWRDHPFFKGVQPMHMPQLIAQRTVDQKGMDDEEAAVPAAVARWLQPPASYSSSPSIQEEIAQFTRNIATHERRLMDARQAMPLPRTEEQSKWIEQLVANLNRSRRAASLASKRLAGKEGEFLERRIKSTKEYIDSMESGGVHADRPAHQSAVLRYSKTNYDADVQRHAQLTRARAEQEKQNTRAEKERVAQQLPRLETEEEGRRRRYAQLILAEARLREEQ